MSSEFFTWDRQKDVVVLLLSGKWDIHHASSLASALQKSASASASFPTITIDASQLETLDTSGAWLLLKYLRHLNKNEENISFIGLSESHQTLLERVAPIRKEAKKPTEPQYSPLDMFKLSFVALGRMMNVFLLSLQDFLTFLGLLFATFMRMLRYPARFRLRATTAHIYHTGIKAIPIIALMAFLISIVLGYQGANQLQKFGATIFTVDLVAISVLREMGVLITAIMVAGRSGSAFAAQIGVMQINEEIDAMKTMGLDPFELLVLPRVIALLIALPALTVIADLVGLIGTWFVANTLLDVSTLQFLTRIETSVQPHTYLIGLVKAPVFAVLIAIAGCLQGLKVERSATAVGNRTTIAVVQSIFLVIVADAVFSVMFTLWGI